MISLCSNQRLSQQAIILAAILILICLMASCVPGSYPSTPTHTLITPTITSHTPIITPGTPTITPTLLPIGLSPDYVPASNIISMNALTSIRLGKGRVVNLIINDQYIYWIEDIDESYISRISIKGGHPEKIATTTYPGGRLSLMNPILSGKWLIFADTNTFNNPDTWKIRALNLENRSEQLVLDIKNDTAGLINSFNLSANGDLLVWTLGLPETYEVATWVLNLSTGEKRELLREKEGATMWSVLAVSGDQAVIERDFDSGRNDLYLLDLTSGMTQPLSTDGESSMPYFDYPWVIWKANHRYDWATKIGLYNVETRQKESLLLDTTAPSDPQLSGRYVYWTVDTSIATDNTTNSVYIFDTTKNVGYILKSPGANQIFDAVAINGKLIVWVRLTNALSANQNSYLEWTTIQP